MAPRSRAPSGTCTGSCRCRRSGPTSITGLPRPARPTARSASKCGCTRVNPWSPSGAAKRNTGSARHGGRRRAGRKERSGRRPTRPGFTTMLMPKKVKYRKQQRGRMRGKAWRGSDVSFGDYGLKALEPCWLTDRQIEAARVAMTRFIKRGGENWGRRFPHKPIPKKPPEKRLGKGKGAPEQWVAVVRPGKVLFEMEGISEKDAREAMKLAAAKIPIRTKFATRFAEEKAL